MNLKRTLGPEFSLLAIFLLFASSLAAAPVVSFEQLHSFDGTNGSIPEAALVLGGDGFMYGTTLASLGAGNPGTVFRLSAAGSYSLLTTAPAGHHLQAGLVLGGDGALYGASYDGGALGIGSVFRVSSGGAVETVFSFDGSAGYSPNSLALGRDGAFYATTYYGGSNAERVGTICKISPNGEAATLLSFAKTNGANPQCAMRLGPDGNFYGAALGGGPGGFGTVLRLSSRGELTALAYFSGTNGATPLAPPLPARDGNLYGTTSAGGRSFFGTPYSGHGTIYKISRRGEFSTLAFFDGTNGSLSSFSGLIEGAEGRLYGTTERGGRHGRGTVFQVTTGGALNTLWSFGGPDGAEPSAGLLQGVDGAFYGVTMTGGAHDYGTIFRLRVQNPVPGSAQLTLRCNDLAFGPARSTNTSLQFLFTTWPLVHPVRGEAAGEFRSDPNTPNRYKADYLAYDAALSRVVERGSITLDVPPADLDGNSVPDLIQASLDVDAGVTGTVAPSYSLAGIPVTRPAISGRLLRRPGQTVGTFTFNLLAGAEAAPVTGHFQIMQWTGTVKYRRAARKTSATFRLATSPGAPMSLRGSMRLDAGEDVIILRGFHALRRGFRSAAPVSLVRNGTAYTGVLNLADGLVSTPWPDLQSWTLELTGLNDADSDGIPDIGDTASPDRP